MTAGLARVGVIGGGAWGTALAALAAENGEAVLWARNDDVVAMINRDHANALYLPDVTLPAALRATSAFAALKDCDALLLAVPAQSLRSFGDRIADELPGAAPLVIASKGIEIATGRLPAEVLAETLPGRALAILTGPNFAAEIARGLPAAATLACADAALGAALVQRLGRPTFRPYFSDDVTGAQVGGAVKNVLAIACGIVIGRRLGDNARAALITRGLAEMTRLGLSLGAKRETLTGLSGLGDLVLTCSGPQSRNLSLGIALGEGRILQEVLAARRSIAEGVYTAQAIGALAARQGVEMPICEAVDAILHRGASIDEALQALLSRPFRAET
ncbi:MAG TPA: NAD(P)H-dependent glycerol-3-phosphate dehydrogenase [Ferrovibrio sp.]|uniref:NAD(P)H-dependent glycerol-3-phosphate dehydrogenase n=1 Tax=Ferrovibrio sp. TaxID=1917215 RepID=UPI002B4B87BE|nr:NAD(P)H-dependent glycerol-3-phosphate dehydrogenase [Ferrovibrio sp.]HLT77772.1 NAD(P)H-dependent glycerol-3-phosphate dehydrogenase [Ferrovibrio sp.]